MIRRTDFSSLEGVRLFIANHLVYSGKLESETSCRVFAQYKHVCTGCRSQCLCCFLPIIRCACGAHLDVGLAQQRSPCRFVGTLRVPFPDVGIVLQCVAVCCSVLQYVAVCCSVLQCVAVCCSVLHCVAVRCSVLHSKTCKSRRKSYCIVLQCAAVCCSVLQYVAVCCRVLKCVA